MRTNDGVKTLLQWKNSQQKSYKFWFFGKPTQTNEKNTFAATSLTPLKAQLIVPLCDCFDYLLLFLHYFF